MVNGDDVTMYALAAEHTLKDIVRWNGDRGASYFFQAELPYDVEAYPYSGYNVTGAVTEHVSYGAGVYHFFRDYPVVVESAITCPPALESSFHDPLAVFLNGNGSILHILNDKVCQPLAELYGGCVMVLKVSWCGVIATTRARRPRSPRGPASHRR